MWRISFRNKGEAAMKTGNWAAACAVILVVTLASARAQQQGDASAMKVGPKAIGGENGIPAHGSQQDWLVPLKNRSCVGCHPLGQEATRTIPAAFADLSSEDAWMRRIQSGQSAPFMINPLAGQLGGAPFKYFAQWTDSIAHGQLPSEKPPRPQGIERNVVITEWGWGGEKTYMHDAISTDKRNPTVNAYRKI